MKNDAEILPHQLGTPGKRKAQAARLCCDACSMEKRGARRNVATQLDSVHGPGAVALLLNCVPRALLVLRPQGPSTFTRTSPCRTGTHEYNCAKHH
jgi:hypothetical protein